MLNKKQVKKVAELARLELSEEELEDLREDLSSILDYVEKLEEVDTSQVDDEPIFSIQNQFREDSPDDSSEKLKEKMKAMGEHKDDYFKMESI